MSGVWRVPFTFTFPENVIVAPILVEVISKIPSEPATAPPESVKIVFVLKDIV